MNHSKHLISLWMACVLACVLACSPADVGEEEPGTGPSFSPFSTSGTGESANSYAGGASVPTGPLSEPFVPEEEDVAQETGPLAEDAGTFGADGSEVVEDGLGSDATACNPNCAGQTCGDDGCGGSCGACAPGSLCDGAICLDQSFEECEAGEGEYQGIFEGIMIYGAIGFLDFTLDTNGVFLGTLECQGLDGSLVGTFSGDLADSVYTFSVTGKANYSTGKMTWDLSGATVVAFGGQVQYWLSGEGSSTGHNENQWEGDWSVASDLSSSIGGNIPDADIKPLTGTGTWILGKLE